MPKPQPSTPGERISVLEAEVEHASEQRGELLRMMKEVRDELKGLRNSVDTEVAALKERQTKVETRVDKVLGNVRAFGAGMAATFTLIGAAAGATLHKLWELFQ